jgi:hypothetical protein
MTTIRRLKTIHTSVSGRYARSFLLDVGPTDVDSDSSYYRPLMWVVYNAIYSFAGAAPWAFHLVNLLLHACVTTVVFFLTLELWKDLRIAGIAGVLFALHPVHSEPVVWIAAVPDLAYTLFFLLALYFYVFNYKPEAHAVIASVTCFAVALLWKESAITFLPCAVAYDAFVLRKFRLGRWGSLLAVTVAYLIVRTLVLGGLAPAVVHEGMSATTQILTAISHLGTYLEKLLVPANLTFFYSLQALSRIDVRVVAVVLTFVLAAWKLRGKMAWSVLLIPLTLLPALAVSHVVVPLAERNLYLAWSVWLARAQVPSTRYRRAITLANTIDAYLRSTGSECPLARRDYAVQPASVDPENSSYGCASTETGDRGRFDEALPS